MRDTEATKGFARSEVRLEVQGDVRVLRSRLVSHWRRVLLLALLALGALVVPALDLRLDTVVLRCSRAEAACTVRGGEGDGSSIPLSSVRGFTTRQPRKQKPDLLAQTTSGDVVLVHRWPREELRAHAEALDALRRGGGSAEWAFTYRRGVQALREDLPIFGMLFALMIVLVGTQLGWRTRLDRRGRRVVRWKPLSRAVRPIDAFQAVLVRSMAHGRPSAPSPQMQAMLEAHLQIALVERGGGVWPITRFVTCPPAEVEARAAEVAAYLNLPVARPEDPLPTVLAERTR